MSKKALIYKTFKTVIQIVTTYSKIINSLENKKTLLKQHKNLIVKQIISLTNSISLKRACSTFNITTNQF